MVPTYIILLLLLCTVRSSLPAGHIRDSGYDVHRFNFFFFFCLRMIIIIIIFFFRYFIVARIVVSSENLDMFWQRFGEI